MTIGRCIDPVYYWIKTWQLEGISLARVYDTLGFEALAVNEATKSLSRDPANHSAHRFLADAYSRKIRFEVARVSEQLQAQMLQPININPRQPSLSVSDLNIAVGAGPSAATFSEFHRLFERNRVSVTGAGLVGNNDSVGEELVFSGVLDNVSFSLGQFHSKSDGFRSNNDVENNVYDAFAQIAISPNLGAQAEYLDRDSEFGDLVLGIDSFNFSDVRRTSKEDWLARFGLTYKPSNYLTSLFSWIHAEQTFGDSFSNSFRVDIDDQSDLLEAQIIGLQSHYNIVLGGSYSIADSNRRRSIGSGPEPIIIAEEDKLESYNGYLYIYNNNIDDLTITLGGAVDQIEEPNFEGSRIHPKFGLEWRPMPALRLRAAIFETMKRSQRTERTIEPSHVAGFNQFFDEFNGTRSRNYGIGADATMFGRINVGGEFTIRQAERPIITSNNIADFRDERDDVLTGYVYLPISNGIALSIEPELSWFDSKEPIGSGAEETRTLILPVNMRYFHQNGLQLGIDVNWVQQDLEEFDNVPNTSLDEEFVTIDARLAYQLPEQQGILSFEVRNLLDEEFGFQDDNFRNARVRQPRFVPNRTFFARATMNF